jgi:ornithine carbamoyltransferase
MRHLIDPLDLTQQEITQLLDLADRICADPEYKIGRPRQLFTGAECRDVPATK